MTDTDNGKNLYEDLDVDEKKKGFTQKNMTYEDDNVTQAIDYRNHKQKHTDFFFKLTELKERIEVYNEVFRSKKPKYLHQESKALKVI